MRPQKTELVIRRAKLGDLTAITQIYNEAVQTTTATFGTEPNTLDERRTWFENHDHNHPIFVAELGGKVQKIYPSQKPAV